MNSSYEPYLSKIWTVFFTLRNHGSENISTCKSVSFLPPHAKSQGIPIYRFLFFGKHRICNTVLPADVGRDGANPPLGSLRFRNREERQRWFRFLRPHLKHRLLKSRSRICWPRGLRLTKYKACCVLSSPSRMSAIPVSFEPGWSWLRSIGLGSFWVLSLPRGWKTKTEFWTRAQPFFRSFLGFSRVGSCDAYPINTKMYVAINYPYCFWKSS